MMTLTSTTPTDTEHIARTARAETDAAARRWIAAEAALESALADQYASGEDGDWDTDALAAELAAASGALVALVAPGLVGLGDGYRPAYCVHFTGDGVPMSVVLGPADDEPTVFRQRRP